MSTTPTFVTTPKIGPVEFTSADSANTKKTLLTAGANGAKVGSVTCSSTDTVDKVAQVWLTRSGTSYLLTASTLTAGSGTDGALDSVDLFTHWPGMAFDVNGLPYVLLESGDKLEVSLTATLTAGKKVHVVSVYASF